MSFQLRNKKALSQFILQQAKVIETALIFQLEVAVAELQNHAKLSAEYDDQTSNLKSSIGGVVLKNGKPISYKGFEGSQEGSSVGTTFINSLIGNYGKGFVILIVAGMEYATYVENYHNLNVLKKTELKLNREIPKIIASLKLKIK